ncbi:unnamed protein product [Amaranthus hypochondriacus]
MFGFINDSTVVQKLETMKAKMKRLTARKDDVCDECNQAELQPGKRKRHEVDNWLETYKNKRSEFESIVDECQPSGSVFTNKKLNDRIDAMTKEVEDLIKEGQFPNGLLLNDPKTKEVPFCLESFYGERFHENVQMIQEWLSDPLAYSIGVLGMGGIGKTTLLKNIYNKLLEGDYEFKKGRVFWVTVSSDCHLYMLQDKVAKAIGVELSSEEDVDRRAAALYSSFVNIKENVVLFLDDVWENFQLTSIGILNQENGCKSNIIFSTRKEEVCRSIGYTKYIIRVQILSKHEAWDLFKNKLETYDSLSSEVQEKAKSVAKECACLPLAIIVIARIMKGVFDMKEWENALAELKNPSRGNEDMEKDVLRILKFSYDRLNNELLKQCFLSCVLYPEDSMINKEYLIKEWIMEGLLDDVGSNSDDQMNKGHTLIKQLQNACLLESSTDMWGHECVKMHDLVRDMAISITNYRPRFLVKSGKQLQEVPEEGLWSQDLVKVSLSDNYDITVIPYGMAPWTPILTVLTLNCLSITEIPEPFFDHMRALKVLDLSYNYNIKRVPESVSKLEKLRALLLKGCQKLTYLPSLAKLTNLRVLDLDFESKLEEGVRGIEGLKKLEKVTYCPWIINNDMTGFNGLIQRSHQLKCYRFWLTSRDHFDYHKYIRTKRENFLHRERALCITGVEFGEETLGALNCRYLIVYECKGLEYILTETQQLETIQVVDLYKLPDLIRLVEFQLGSCSFSQLYSLNISKCPKLKVLFSFNKKLNLPNLKVLCVEECDLLECIFESNNGTLPNLVLSLPNLEDLFLSDLPKLHYIYEGLLVYEQIGDVEISKCPKLKVLFSFKKELNLPNLKVLCVEECDLLECIFESNNGTLPNLVLSLPNLKVLTLIDLPKLHYIYEGLLVCENLKCFRSMWGYYNCPEFQVLYMSKNVICPASPSTLASISKVAEFWEIFQQYEPQNLTHITNEINQILKCDTMLADVDNEIEIKEDKLEWGAYLSLLFS